ncbi:PfkB family carbohydrate kinase [soil metagenome]
MSLLAVGTVAFDTIETPFGRAERVLGGSATYITLAARQITSDVRLVGVVGGDFPVHHIDMLKKHGVDTEGLVIEPNGQTFFWAGRYHYDLNQRDTLATHLNVLADFKPNLPERYRDSRIVCLGNLDPGVQLAVLDQIHNPEIVILDTMNFWIQNTPEVLKQVLKRIDVLIVNDAEARELTGEPNLVRAARAIREMGPETLVIKKGEHGALLFCDDTIFSAPAYPLEDIQDPTGAGDAFMGGFAGYLDRIATGAPGDFRRAVVLGSALASFVVEAFGPERLIKLEEGALEHRLEAFHALSSIPEAILA